MEDLELQPCTGVHRMLIVVTALIELPTGPMQRSTREFGGYKRECRALAE